MNEIIQQLAEQAGEEVVAEEFDLYMVTETSDGATLKIPAAFIEKFAELLVRECSTLAYDGPSGILEHFNLDVDED